MFDIVSTVHLLNYSYTLCLFAEGFQKKLNDFCYGINVQYYFFIATAKLLPSVLYCTYEGGTSILMRL
jgi:hypothetical protein